MEITFNETTTHSTNFIKSKLACPVCRAYTLWVQSDQSDDENVLAKRETVSISRITSPYDGTQGLLHVCTNCQAGFRIEKAMAPGYGCPDKDMHAQIVEQLKQQANAAPENE